MLMLMFHRIMPMLMRVSVIHQQDSLWVKMGMMLVRMDVAMIVFDQFVDVMMVMIFGQHQPGSG